MNINIHKKNHLSEKIIYKINNYFKLIKALIFKEAVYLNYQMGKVGSSSIGEYIKINDKIEWHVHRFYNTNVFENNKKKPIFTFLFDFLFLKLLFLRRNKIYVICGIRDLLYRNISMFFYIQYDYLINLPFSEVYEKFKIINKNSDSHLWFEQEMNKIFKVDILKEWKDKNTDGKFLTFSKKNIDFLIYKLEFLNDIENDVGKYLNLKDFKLINKNQASNIYSKEILNLKKNLEKTFIKNKCYYKNTNFMRVFYSEKNLFNK